jgi:3-oxoadipate enol-lactonase
MSERFSRRDCLHASSRVATATGLAVAVGALLAANPTSAGAAPNAAAESGECADAQLSPSVSLAPGLQIHYKDDWLGRPWTKPDAALFLHGNLENGDVWFGWVPRMGQRFRLLRPDLPGFGLSTAPANFDWSLANFAAVMANFLDKLGIPAAHIIGAKTGGAIAMQFAATYPQRTKSLVVASGPFTPVDPKFENSPQKVRLGSAATDDEIAYFDKLRAAMRPETRAGMAKLLTGINFDNVLPRIQAPALVITSDRSALQTVQTVIQYQPKIPNSRLLVLTSDAYHVAVANADECVTGVLSFIQGAQKAS